MRTKLYYENRIHLLTQRDEMRNIRLINKLKRIYKRKFGVEYGGE